MASDMVFSQIAAELKNITAQLASINKAIIAVAQLQRNAQGISKAPVTIPK